MHTLYKSVVRIFILFLRSHQSVISSETDVDNSQVLLTVAQQIGMIHGLQRLFTQLHIVSMQLKNINSALLNILMLCVRLLQKFIYLSVGHQINFIMSFVAGTTQLQLLIWIQLKLIKKCLVIKEVQFPRKLRLIREV